MAFNVYHSEQQNGKVKHRPLAISLMQPAIWFHPECLPKNIESIIYWRDVRKSSFIFLFGLGAIFAMACMSIIKIFALSALFLLIGGVCIRFYKYLLKSLHIDVSEHRFDGFYDANLYVSPEKARNIAGFLVENLNIYIQTLRRLFAAENLNESFKFSIILWIMTYIGSWFNGLTVFLMAYLFLFSAPKLYETHTCAFNNIFNITYNKYSAGLSLLRSFLAGKVTARGDIMAKDEKEEEHNKPE